MAVSELDPNQSLDAYWMPFSHNRYFKQDAAHRSNRMLAKAEGSYYWTTEGNRLYDALSGLWCCGLGHRHPRLVEAVKRQLDVLDYATAFQMGTPAVFHLAERIAEQAPAGFEHVFFCNSGSEAVDTALKMALAYHRARGEAHRTRFIGREKGYHGVGFGGISVGGMVANRKMFAAGMLQGVDHLPHTHNLKEMAFSRGEPQWGLHLVEELERLVALHDASTIAAVIVEPMQGSAGVIVPPAGYLKRLREICSKHGILLIFDEVITAFGRMGKPFAAQHYGVSPDLITFAKGVNNGLVPMGGVLATRNMYDTFMAGPAHLVEFFHGYTYSGHALAVAAAHATLDVLADEQIYPRVESLAGVLEECVHSLKGEANIVDIRNCQLAAAVELAPLDGKPGLRALRVFEEALKRGVLFRFTGDIIAMGPTFISSPDELAQMTDVLRQSIHAAG
ncbi:aspartate aminotransferase family protein [Chitinimonas arctica]|uniref:Aspartate aminotransferase family protein n=1 Tax=Chitinimonas arctica TaxID=2594795 RepID=A0A516SHV6_9NEIS|nr:aspartate aminotransferase family protein [Chitinimonas arctica]QDQ27734.1 aspartate aminotransferase family protein [Chitinimonas arctica]